MDSLRLLLEYGYPLLAICVFLEAIGFPVPAAAALLAAGAAAAKGLFSPWEALAVALLGTLTGDVLLFLLGRKTGWWLLGVLCRVSMNPEACIYSSAAQFYRRGRTALLVAKFVPGFNTMAAPIAGSMNMPLLLFLRYDLGGALLYVGFYGVIGFTCSEAIGAIAQWFGTLGRALGLVVGLGVALYFGWRWWRNHRLKKHDVVPRVSPSELAARLSDDIVIADVRSHGYYDANAERIRGSIRIEPNLLPQTLAQLPQGKDVFLYCSCQSEATSQRVAEILNQSGYEVKVLEGGLSAWKKAGHPLERVPAEDVVHLPRFA
ncbi:rhodanese-like domain-containing protein [Bryobacter aggregatus]|uniref:rhodanese-like domain-containing protein n=1 Tax=Bryobacter aggregatus TaxID=360054 RepID=UPI0004E26CCA|nr:rhodanese-like domain-containing protein [Bryobacter aggregatus]